MSEIKLFEVGTVVKERTSSTVVLEKDTEKATLSSMREVENAANMFYYTEE